MKISALPRFPGRESPRLMQALRGTLAALAALTVAVLLQLKCPYWAAMTALIVIQPTRGLLWEKSFYRLVGTAVGSLAGLSMLLAGRSPAMISLLLALWLAGCVGTGNLLYGLRSYGAMVAGCTGAIIALAGYNDPPDLHELVFGRVAGIVVGILVSSAVSMLFTKESTKRQLPDLLLKVAAAAIECAALHLSAGEGAEPTALRRQVLLEIAEIEGGMDASLAGSPQMKKRKRQFRKVIVSLLCLLEAGKLAGDQMGRFASERAGLGEDLAGRLRELARELGQTGFDRQMGAGVQRALVEAGGHLPLLARELDELLDSLQRVGSQWHERAKRVERPAGRPYIRHRDWREAGRAALRAASAIAAVGLCWQLTGFGEGPMTMMAASIMVSFFSTHDHPAVMLKHVFFGASVGVAAALFGRLVLLPGTSDTFRQAVVSAPVLLAGILALSHRRTARGAMDAMLFFLFVMQPGVPAVPAAAVFLAGALAALGGVGVALVAFRYLLPVDPARRLRSLSIAIARDLVAMAAADPVSMEKSRARSQHRVLRLLATARKLDRDPDTTVDGGLAALSIGRCLTRLRDEEANGGISTAASDAVRETTHELRAAIQRPSEILSTLEAVSRRLAIAMEPQFGARNFAAGAPFPQAAREYPSAVSFFERETGTGTC